MHTKAWLSCSDFERWSSYGIDGLRTICIARDTAARNPRLITAPTAENHTYRTTIPAERLECGRVPPVAEAASTSGLTTFRHS
jgi:hypothetical protein